MKRKLFLVITAIIGTVFMAFPDWVNTGNICYDLRPGNTAYVTYRYYGDNSTQTNYYKGELEIPEEFEYNSQTYKVTGINAEAFRSCTKLTKITIPASVKVIGGDAFLYCSSLDEVVFKDGEEPLVLYDYKVLNSSSGMTYVSGSLFQNSPVKTLYLGRNLDTSNLARKGDVFEHPAIASLTIGKYVDVIPDLFDNKSSLATLHIEEGVREIDSYAFQSCGITELVIPNSITRIGRGAFGSNQKLTKVKFGSGMELCELNAFQNCRSLKEVHIADLKDWLKIRFGNEANGLRYAEGLMVNGQLLTDLRINASTGISTIDSYAFKYCASLKSIDLNGVENIGDSAFANCPNLKSVRCDSSLLDLGGSAFSSCAGLETATFSNSIEKLGSSVFADCINLQSVTGLDGVPQFSISLFENCENLLDMPQSNGITSIGSKAFYGCGSLTNIVIPSTVTYVQANAFAKCGKITLQVLSGEGSCQFDSSAFSDSQINKLSLGRDFVGTGIFANQVELENVEFMEGLTTIPNSTFEKCVGIREITIPSSVVSIGTKAFDGCNAISKISFLDGSQSLSLGSNWVSVNEITDLYVGRNLAGSSLFANSKNLVNLKFGKECTQIGSNCFSKCTALKNVVIPENITIIGDGAFNECTGLTEFKFPINLKKISANILKGCSSLSEISIPSAVTAIESGALAGCSSLRSVIFEDADSDVILRKGVFDNCPIEHLYVGSNIWLDNGIYSTPFNVGTLTDVVFGNEVSVVGAYMFKDCTQVKSVEFPQSLTTIGANAFANCTQMKSVRFPQSLTTIGANAFSGCAMLVSEDRTINVETISSGAFENCKNISVKELSKNIKNIGSNAFKGCDIPELSIIGEAVIGSSAFAQCGMQKLRINEDCLVQSDSFTGNNLYSTGKLSSTQTTVSVVCDVLNIELLSSATGKVIDNRVYISYDGKTIERNKETKFTGLVPSTDYTVMLSPGLPLGQIRTLAIGYGVKSEGKAFANSLPVRVTVGPMGDADLQSAVLKFGDLEWNVKDNELIAIPITPRTKEFSVSPILEVRASGRTFQSSISAAIPALEWKNEIAVATSLVSARLIADVNLNDTAGATGIEWRRNDAPANVKSQEALCPVVNEKLYGSLFGLRDDVYYMYRPYYQLTPENRIYGEWVGFYTGDALVYFEPEVITMNCVPDVTSATFEGFALAGSEEIGSQGFEYRILSFEIENDNDWIAIESSGILMRTEVDGLMPDHEYEYRAYVSTKSSTVFGEPVKFRTLSNDDSGISLTTVDYSSDYSIRLKYENAYELPAIQINGTTKSSTVRVFSMDGTEIYSGIVGPNEWVCPITHGVKGHYIIWASDGDNKKAIHVMAK